MSKGLESSNFASDLFPDPNEDLLEWLAEEIPPKATVLAGWWNTEGEDVDPHITSSESVQS